MQNAKITLHKIVPPNSYFKFLLMFFGQNLFTYLIICLEKGKYMTNIITLSDQSLRHAITEKKMELFEVKQMAEMEHKFKIQCQIALKDYKGWWQQHREETDALELFYGQLHVVVLKRRAQDAVQAYWIIRKDFRIVFDRYLAAHQPYKPSGVSEPSNISRKSA